MNRALPVHWGLVFATVASLAAIVALRSQQPSFDQKTAPMPVAGTAGTRVEARNFNVKVNKVKLARAYLVDGRSRDAPPREVVADGIWVSALVDVEASRENGFVSAQLRARDGRTYRAAPNERPDLKGFNLSETYLVAGLPASGAYFFDVPPDALEGARLQFYSGTLAPAQLDHLADVDLGLDAAKVETMRADAAPMIDLRSPEPSE